jgi:hypothetical protein
MQVRYFTKSILTFLMFGCALGLPPRSSYLGVDDLVPHITYAWEGNTANTVIYYIVEPGKLELANDPIKYVGTVDSYHLFMVIPKRPVAPDELFNFAVLKKHCIIDKPDSPEAERGRNRPRWIEIKDGRIVVRNYRS